LLMSATGTIYADQCSLTSDATLPAHAVRYSQYLAGVDGGFYTTQSLTSSITESTTIAPGSNVKTLRIIVTMTNASYVHSITLSNTNRAFGDKIEMMVKAPLGSSATIVVYAGDGSTELLRFTNQNVVMNVSAEFMHDGSVWNRYR